MWTLTALVCGGLTFSHFKICFLVEVKDALCWHICPHTNLIGCQIQNLLNGRARPPDSWILDAWFIYFKVAKILNAVYSWDCPLYLKQSGLSCREPHSTLLLFNLDKWPLKINCDPKVSRNSCISFPAKPDACKRVKAKDQTDFIISAWCFVFIFHPKA